MCSPRTGRNPSPHFSSFRGETRIHALVGVGASVIEIPRANTLFFVPSLLSNLLLRLLDYLAHQPLSLADLDKILSWLKSASRVLKVPSSRGFGL